ncbi:MAG TPA: YbaL family putative K(+) efflux transporter [Rhizomicrobium sp.]|nr:YbaL family putative K(+) efflux transporter [Rhizomicrobium sp.]
MEHMSPLIGILVIGLGLAFVLGTVVQRLRLPPLVGYLLAGVVVGPFSPGITLDQHLTLQLADIGVVLLMFGVGLHFKPGDLLEVKTIVVPGAVLQMAAITALGVVAGFAFGWTGAQGLVFGLCLSVASTVVVMRALQDRRLTETGRGHIAIGWLVVQDLLMVLVLVILPPVAEILKGGDIQTLALVKSLGITFGKLALFAGLMLVIGRRVIPAILHYIAHTGSRELFRLAVLSVALSVAFAASYLFGVSIALGAFFGGMILAGSRLSQRAAEESLPLRDAFAVLFFVSVGMLFDPRVVLHQPLALATTFAIVLAGGGICYVLLRLFGVKSAGALTIAVSLAQIGEFSFILADLGIGLKVLPDEARGLILGASILSIFLNPLLFALAAKREASPNIAPAPDMPRPAPEPTKLSGHAVLVGYGRVGRVIAEGIKNSLPLLVMEEGAVGDPGIEHIRGNAARDDVLAAANLGCAKLLFVAIPEAFEAGQIVQQARRANPGLPIVARAHFDAEVDHLLSLGASKVIMGEREIALAMLDFAKDVQPAAS